MLVIQGTRNRSDPSKIQAGSDQDPIQIHARSMLDQSQIRAKSHIVIKFAIQHHQIINTFIPQLYFWQHRSFSVSLTRAARFCRLEKVIPGPLLWSITDGYRGLPWATVLWSITDGYRAWLNR